MSHSVSLANLTLIFALSDGRMIRCEFAQLAVRHKVQARIPDVANHNTIVLAHQRKREHACHTAPFVVLLREAVDLVVCRGDRFPQAIFRRTSGACQGGRDDANGSFSGGFASGLAPDSIHNQKHTSGFVDKDAILIVGAL
jgi:hypothetical protein